MLRSESYSELRFLILQQCECSGVDSCINYCTTRYFESEVDQVDVVQPCHIALVVSCDKFKRIGKSYSYAKFFCAINIFGNADPEIPGRFVYCNCFMKIVVGLDLQLAFISLKQKYFDIVFEFQTGEIADLAL